MSFFQRYQKDANHNEIVDYLEINGVEVIECANVGKGFTDLIICGEITAFLEIKAKKGAVIYLSQIEFISEIQKIPVQILTTKEDALMFAKNPRELGLTDSQKFKMRKWLHSLTITPKRIELARFEKEVFRLGLEATIEGKIL